MLKGHGGNLREAAARLGLDPGGIVDFSASVNPFVDAAALKEIMEQALDAVGRYPDPDYTALREKIGISCGRPPETIIVGNGSTELLYLVPRALAPKTALVVSPAYADYADALRMAGTEMTRHYLEAAAGFAPDFRALNAALARGFDMAVVGNPNNPTGTVFPRDELLALIRTHRNTTFMVDESFADFAPGFSLMDAPAPNLVLIRSLTKFYGIPGLRVGFAAADAALIQTLIGRKEPWTLNCVAEAAAMRFLDDPRFAQTAGITGYLRQRFEAGLSAIPSLRVFPSAANFILVRVEGNTMTAAQLQTSLLKRGFLVRDCANFDGLDPYYLRVAVRGEEENVRLAQSIRAALE